MSTAGSTRSAELSAYTPPGKTGDGGQQTGGRKRSRVFRWQGIIPLVVVSVLVALGWTLLSDRIARATLSEAGTKALGAQLDIAELNIRTFSTSLEIKGIALADPFDPNRNLFEVGQLLVELEPRPLLQKKFVIKRLNVANVRTGTRRLRPAAPVSGGGLAPSALAEVKRFAQQFQVPLLALTPIDTLKSLVLDPTQLKAVQAALSVTRAADSTKQAIETSYAALRIQETVDSSAALVSRLQGTNVRALGVDGARRAVADVRRAIARVDSAKMRTEALLTETRRGVGRLEAGVAGIDEARRDDYAFASGLLKLPSLETPDIGAALFGKVTIDKFQQAVYWSTLARKYAPPGLLPKKSEGPERLRKSGTTVHFVTAESYPNFLLRRADVTVDITSGMGSGKYSVAATDITSDPAIIGRPMLFAVRRTTTGGALDSLRITGSLDHRATPRNIVNVAAAGVQLPALSVPSLPYSMDPGRGTTEMRFVLDGDRVSGRWLVRSKNLSWTPDSARARRMNTVEALVARVLTGIPELELTADIGGTLKEPTLSVRSNLDRQVADRLRAVVGEEVRAAQAKVRAQVDRLVDEKSAPVKARVAEIRTEGERRITEARGKLDDEKRKLEERLKALSAGALNLPRLPGVQGPA
jgi:uncharacterized protein (TIGR03545 family)